MCPACWLESALTASDLPDIGPAYVLEEVLGEGGMGTVYRAQQQDPVQRTVAVKILKTGLDSRGVLRRFEAERDILSQLDHPNIARLYDAGTALDGRPFFVMELVDGDPLTGYGDYHSLPLHERLKLFLALLEGVQHAHQKGIIHRDLKPSNLLVAAGAVPKVIDFGIAKASGAGTIAWDGDSLRTQVGAVLGTLEYMSPEQASGRTHQVDTRADIYSLGAVLYELLTGSQPLPRAPGETLFETMRRIQEEEPLSPARRIATLPPAQAAQLAGLRKTTPARWQADVERELDWITRKALEKDPARRYTGIAHLASDLQSFLNGDPVSAAPPSRAYRAGKWIRKNKTATALGVSALLAIVAGGGISLWQAAEARRGMRAAQANELAMLAEMRGAEDPEVGLLLAMHAVGQTHAAGEAPTRGARAALHRAILTPPLPQRWRLEGTESATHVIYAPDGATLFAAGENGAVRLDPRSGKVLQSYHSGQPGAVFALAVSPDARWVATGNDDRTAHLFDAATGKLLHQFPAHGHFVRGLAFSPNSQRLASAGMYGDIHLWEVPTGRLVAEWKQPAAIWTIGFTPSGQLLTGAVARRGGARLWDLASAGAGKEVVQFTHEGAQVSGVAASPDGKLVATGGTDNTGRVWTTGGTLLKTLRGHTDIVMDVQFSPDSSHVLTTSKDDTVRLWQASTGRLVRTFAGHGDMVARSAFSPDGRNVATACTDGLVRIWDNRDAPELTRLEDETLPLFVARLHPDLTQLTGSFNTDVRVWNLEGKLLRVSAEPSLSLSVAYDRAGRALATSEMESRGEVRVRDAATGVALGQIAADGVRLDSLDFSPDGHWLAGARQDGKVIFWHRETLTVAAIVPALEGPIATVEFAPDSKHLAASGLAIRLLAFEQGQWRAREELKGHTEKINSLRFSHDGRRLASAGHDKTIRLWEGPSWRTAHVLRGHSGTIQRLAWSAAGEWLASGSDDASARLWDPASGQEVAALMGPKDGIVEVAFRAGRELIVVHENGIVVRHALRLEDLLRAARSRLQRTLTAEECTVFFHGRGCPALPE